MSIQICFPTVAASIFLGLTACADPSTPVSAAKDAPPFDDRAALAVDKLRTYCAACHGLGPLRFISSDNNQNVWDDLYTEHAPGSHEIWAEGIATVLDWPSESPPPFDHPMDPTTGHDWMPKGELRLRLANDRTEGTTTRRFLYSMLD